MKETNMLIQFIIVGLLLLGASIWIIRQILKLNRKNDNTGCTGCSLSEVCSEKKKDQKNINHSK